jgi:uncharacterized protein YqeY
MSLELQLTEDMKNAMRAKDSVRLNTIRFVLSQLKNWKIDHGEQDDAGVAKIIAREVKQMKEANEEFRRGGREDLVAEEEVKIKILEEYLPKQLGADVIQEKVKAVVAANAGQPFGVLMKLCLTELQGQADGAIVSQILKEELAR